MSTSRKTRIQIVGKQEEHAARWRRDELRELACALHWEWRTSQEEALGLTVSALEDDPSDYGATGTDDSF
jgi:hypothetical protein